MSTKPHGTTTCEVRRPAEGRELPIVVHIPYASRAIPAEEREQVGLSDAELRVRLPQITDDLLDRVFAILPHLGATVVTNRLSRLVMDPLASRVPADSTACEGGLDADTLLRLLAGPLRNTQYASEPRGCLRDYLDSLVSVIQESVDRDGFCVLIEARTWTSDSLDEKTMEQDAVRLRVATHSALTPPWLIAPWQDEGFSRHFEWRELEASELSPLTASLQERFGAGLCFLQVEVDRHSYLDLHDGCCFHRWSPGPDFVRFVMAQITDLLDERCHYRRREMTREEAFDYACQYRLINGGLRHVAEVNAWSEMGDKPFVAGLTVNEVNDCWVVRYGRDHSQVIGLNLVSLFDRVTGDSKFRGLQHDWP